MAGIAKPQLIGNIYELRIRVLDQSACLLQTHLVTQCRVAQAGLGEASLKGAHTEAERSGSVFDQQLAASSLV
jgi:hypothetical protein